MRTVFLKKGIGNNLSEITENGLTIAEELEILESEKNDKIHGPFKNTKALEDTLKK